MTDSNIQELIDKYIIKKSSGENLPRAKGNVQAQINKINSIHKYVRNQDIGQNELNRLESAVTSLYDLIRTKSG